MLVTQSVPLLLKQDLHKFGPHDLFLLSSLRRNKFSLLQAGSKTLLM
jgi:hypothetical protein